MNSGSGRVFREKEAEEILDLHGNSILRLAISYLHNKEDAEDILQETMIDRKSVV